MNSPRAKAHPRQQPSSRWHNIQCENFTPHNNTFAGSQCHEEQGTASCNHIVTCSSTK